MHNRKNKSKLWFDYRNRKLLKQKTKLKELTKRKGFLVYAQNMYIYEQRNIRKSLPTSEFKAPSNFSFKNACEATATFFETIINKRDSSKEGAVIRIDFSDVSKLSVDALMYLIAVMYDTYNGDKKNIIFTGNMPSHEDAAKIFNRSGFANYVNMQKDEIRPTSNNIKISNGVTTDVELAGKICKYIHANSNLTRIDTIPLYNLIIELMNNTIHHAYGDGYSSDYSKNSWYLFSEKRDNRVVFVFLDTGLGIPKTVYKKWQEKINFAIQDSFLIKSALEGENRTVTKLKNRGKGLPQILECCRSGLIDNAYVYSGNGYCTINKENDGIIQTKEMQNEIFGTLFSWEVII